MTTGSGAAFFDVDDTLVAGVTLFDLLRFDAADRGTQSRADAHLRTLREMRGAGAARIESNRHYFRWWSGRAVPEVAATGDRWFSSALEGGMYFNTAVVAECHRHRAEGTPVVLVSGSFSAALTPIARYLDVSHVLCTSLEIEGGRYTGVVDRPMIGVHKSEAVLAFAGENGVSLEASSAYGDHESDLSLLKLVGDPVVVGARSRVLHEHGTRQGWRTV